MSFNTAEGRAEYTALAGQTAFSFVFKIYKDVDIVAWLTPTGQVPDDTADLLALGVDYTIVVNGDNGGVFTLINPAAAGDYVTLVRSLEPIREIEYPENGELRPDILNIDQNYQTYLMADLETRFGKVVRLPENTQGVDGQMPSPYPDGYIKWNADATALENDTTIPDAVVQSAANAAAAAASAVDSSGFANDSAASANESSGFAFDSAASAADAAQSVIDATDNGQLEVWKAAAEKMTSDSYATEPENVLVKLYTSNGDGTFSFTNSTEYSSLHYSKKSLANSTTISTVASALLIDGTVALDTVQELNFATVAYTGNGTSQDIVTDISSVDFTVSNNGSGFWHDRETGDCTVKNDAGDVVDEGSCVCNVSKVHIKMRSDTYNSYIQDGLRGTGGRIVTNTTEEEITGLTNGVSALSINGFTISASNYVNEDTETYIAYQTLYTHITWGKTNQDKKYVEAYNPVTRETMIMYEGSGNTNHEIPHSLGVKLDWLVNKDLARADDWFAYFGISDEYMYLNEDTASTINANTAIDSNSEHIGLSDINNYNTSSSVTVLYGKANSSTWKIVEYTGTGAAGNQISTGFFGARAIIKSTSASGSWRLFDNARGGSASLKLNVADAEYMGTSPYIIFNSDGFEVGTDGANNPDINASGEQYIALVEADTNSDGGGSYFPKPLNGDLGVTDGLYSYTKGIDDNGFIRTTERVSGNALIDFAGLADGTYWVAKEENGVYKFYTTKPTFDTGSGLWQGETDILSFLPNPIRVVSEEVQYIDYSDELLVNNMDSLNVGKLEVLSSVSMIGLPTVDPAIVGQLWNNNGILNLSNGV